MTRIGLISLWGVTYQWSFRGAAWHSSCGAERVGEGEVFLSWTTRAWEMITTVECPEPLKEFEMTVIKPLSGQQKVLFPLDVFKRQVGNAFLCTIFLGRHWELS